MPVRALSFASVLLILVSGCNGGEKTTGDVSATMATTDGATTTGTTTVESTGTTDAPTSTTHQPSTGPGPSLCDGLAPRVRLVTTMGDMVVQLDAVNAPLTTENFIHYIETGFFEGTIFHRVLDGFVLQGGGLLPDLTEKPTDPPIPLEISPALTHVDGAIAMARTDDPNSATSQFYICDGPQHFLDGDYAVFGVLVEGFDVRDAISAVQTGSEGDYDDVPVTDVIITAASCE
ncbi:peptidylprolyl isomerase [Nannocystis pusilla]|uniref:Peptidyl-prolyl cis-trans isomerase n=1 Tax=Nannocystis pusilla TaxID=889268 RepID=A0ABS7U2V3_9BACT|nr:peptidylprolyl isomerase [Nannocystis pusilla]MBZ5714853.1 peptidylprolyl isomerase [Nannocystis pusilla]